MEEHAVNNKIFYRLIILAVAAFLSPFLLQLTGSSLFKICDDVVFLFLLVDSFIALKKKKIKVNFDKTCALVTLIFSTYIIVELINALINNNNFIVVLLEFRHYKYLFVFYILFYYNDEAVFTKIYKIARIIAFLSVPVSIIQRYLIKDASGDVITGLFGDNASGIMTIFLLILYFSKLSKNISLGNKIINWDILYFIPIGINETKIAFILIPLMFLVAVLIARRNILKNVMIMILISALLLPILSYVYTKNYSLNVWSYFTNIHKLNAYMNVSDNNESSDMGRFLKIKKGYEIININRLSTLVGYGLGSGYVGKGTGEMGQISEKFNNNLLFGATRTQLFDSLVTTGVLGVIFQVAFIIVIFVRLITVKNLNTDFYYVAVLSLITWGICLFYMVIMIQSNLFFLMITSIYMTCMKLPCLERHKEI